MASDESFRDWLKHRRKARDLTQAELAHQVGCSIYTLQHIEEGTARPSRQLAELLAGALEIPAEERPAFVRQVRSLGRGDHAESPLSARRPDPAEAPPANPYKGLRAFQEADAPDFFGRESLAQRLRERLGEETELARFLAVVGPSGAGKSSVVRAGLLPAVRRQALPGGVRPVVVDLIPGAHPLEELEAALLRVARPEDTRPPSLLEELQADERGLARAVQRILPGDDTSELLLVIDQFEELFTLVSDERVRAGFINSLFSAVAAARSRLRVVITLRADFYDRPLRYLPASELLGRRTEVVAPLAADEMYQAITAPAERHGLELERGLAAALMQDVGEQPGTLPLLEYALTELYERREGHRLTLAAYRASGGVFGALARRAEDLYAGLSVAEQAEARQLFLRLVAPGAGAEDTRRRVHLAELRSAVGAGAGPREDALQRVLDLYGRYRLLTFDRDPRTGNPTVEVAHEALLSNWGRLRGWLEASREQLLVQRHLLSAAGEWQAAGQDPSFLARGARLSQFAALPVAADGGAAGLALTAEEQAYLAASLSEQQHQEAAEQARQAHALDLARQAAAAAQHTAAAQRSAANRLRGLVGGLAIFLLVASVLAVFATGQQNEATHQRQVAQDNAATAVANGAAADAQRATAVTNGAAADSARATAQANLTHADALRLVAEANSLIRTGGPSELVGLLSLRSMQLEYTTEGDAVLEGAAQLDYPVRRFVGHGEDQAPVVWLTAFSPDGKTLYTQSGSSTRLWDVATGRQLANIDFGGDAVSWAPDGKHILATHDDGTLYIWNTVAMTYTQSPITHTAALWWAAYSPDGHSILTSSSNITDTTAQVWDAATGRQIQVFHGSAPFTEGWPGRPTDGMS